MELEFTVIKDLKHGLRNINILFIILEVGQLIVTKSKREVRHFKVADESACIDATIWDKPGELLSPGDIVKLTQGYATLWRNSLNLHNSKHGDLQKVGEFSMVFNEEINMSDPNLQANSINSSAINNGTSIGSDVIDSQMLPPNPVFPLPSVSYNNTSDEQEKSPKYTNRRTSNSFRGRNNQKRLRGSTRGGWSPQN